jgi:hypothetical protein
VRELGVLLLVKLPVRRRTVYCPRRQKVVDLGDCTRCPRCQCVGELDGVQHVVCRLPGARSLLK